ncbi:MAG: toll/interleukin-1 receptor domain-containing protein [Candidatus Aminicenantes bacterium]|jgi:hypothetical protein
MKTIFISYAKEDREIACSIYNMLKDHGFFPWIDVEYLLPGQNWEMEIEKAIRGCSLFIACLSTNSVNKRGFVQAEFKKALKVWEMIPEDQAFIIPVRLNECAVPIQFSKFHYLDYFSERGPTKLVKTIHAYLGTGLDIFPDKKNIVIDAAQKVFLVEIAKQPGMKEQVIDYLINSLNFRVDPTERYWSYVILGELGGEKAKSAVLKGLDDNNEFARQGAEDALRLLEQSGK